jgi:suppressor of G2 allele of SKP1
MLAIRVKKHHSFELLGFVSRYDWYQTEKYVTVTVFAKGVQKEDLEVAIQDKKLTLSLYKGKEDEFVFDTNLAYAINTQKSHWKILSTKVEIKLLKVDHLHWESLGPSDATGNHPKYFMVSVEGAVDPPPPTKNPVLCKPGTNWDKFAAEVDKEEKEDQEKLEGDAALNHLLQKIYADGNDEVKKAMQKSFVESKGTVLSTNWGEVHKGRVDMKAPDGMEFKQFEK